MNEFGLIKMKTFLILSTDKSLSINLRKIFKFSIVHQVSRPRPFCACHARFLYPFVPDGYMGLSLL